MSIYTDSARSECTATILSSLLAFSPISAHFAQFIVFYKTPPRRLKASDESLTRPEHQGGAYYSKQVTGNLHSISKSEWGHFRCSAGRLHLVSEPITAFFFLFYLFLFFLCWFECSLKQGGSPRKVIYLFSPYFLLCIVCQAPPVSLGFLSQGRCLWCTSLCVSSSFPRTPFQPFLFVFSLLSCQLCCTVF